MKFAQISKRIFLFLAVNALVLLTILLVLSLLGCAPTSVPADMERS